MDTDGVLNKSRVQRLAGMIPFPAGKQLAKVLVVLLLANRPYNSLPVLLPYDNDRTSTSTGTWYAGIVYSLPPRLRCGTVPVPY
jgi:hypothetical protein